MEVSLLEKISFYVKILFISLIIVIMIAVIAYTRTPAVRIVSERQKAYNLAYEGKYREAVETMNAAVTKFPDQPAGYEALAQLYLNWGSALMEQGDFEEGVRDLGYRELYGLYAADIYGVCSFGRLIAHFDVECAVLCGAEFLHH